MSRGNSGALKLLPVPEQREDHFLKAVADLVLPFLTTGSSSEALCRVACRGQHPKITEAVRGPAGWEAKRPGFRHLTFKTTALLPQGKPHLVCRLPHSHLCTKVGDLTGKGRRAGWHHGLSRHELEQAPGNGEGPGSLACCSPRGRQESDTNERLSNNNNRWSDSQKMPALTLVRLVPKVNGSPHSSQPAPI